MEIFGCDSSNEEKEKKRETRKIQERVGTREQRRIGDSGLLAKESRTKRRKERTREISTINLRYITSSADSHADVNSSKLFTPDDEDGFEDLQSENLGLDEFNGRTVNFDESFSLLAVGHCCGGLLSAKDLDRLDLCLLFSHINVSPDSKERRERQSAEEKQMGT